MAEILLLGSSLLVGLTATSLTLNKRVTISRIPLGLMTGPKLLVQRCARRLLGLEIVFLVREADIVKCFNRRRINTVYGVHDCLHSIVFTLHFGLIKLSQMFLLFLMDFCFA